MTRTRKEIGELTTWLQYDNPDIWFYVDYENSNEVIIYVSSISRIIKKTANYELRNEGSKRFPKWYFVSKDVEGVKFRCVEKPGTFFIEGNKNYHHTNSFLLKKFFAH